MYLYDSHFSFDLELDVRVLFGGRHCICREEGKLTRVRRKEYNLRLDAIRRYRDKGTQPEPFNHYGLE